MCTGQFDLSNSSIEAFLSDDSTLCQVNKQSSLGQSLLQTSLKPAHETLTTIIPLMSHQPSHRPRVVRRFRGIQGSPRGSSQLQRAPPKIYDSTQKLKAQICQLVVHTGKFHRTFQISGCFSGMACSDHTCPTFSEDHSIPEADSSSLSRSHRHSLVPQSPPPLLLS